MKSKTKYYYISYAYESGYGSCYFSTKSKFFSRDGVVQDLKKHNTNMVTVLFYNEISKEEYLYNTKN